jgi:hypothetical protein
MRCMWACSPRQTAPRRAQWGYFAFMAIESLGGSQLWERLLFVCTNAAQRAKCAPVQSSAGLLVACPACPSSASFARAVATEVGAPGTVGGRRARPCARLIKDVWVRWRPCSALLRCGRGTQARAQCARDAPARRACGRGRACAARGRLLKGGHAAYLETVPLRTVAAFTGLQALLLLVVYVRAPGAPVPGGRRPRAAPLARAMSARPAPELPHAGRAVGQRAAWRAPARRDGCSRVQLPREGAKAGRTRPGLRTSLLVPGARASARNATRRARPAGPHGRPYSIDPVLSRSRRPCFQRALRPTCQRRARAGRHLGARRGLPLPHPHHAPGAAAPVRPAQGASGRCPAARRRAAEAALLCEADLLCETASRPAERHVQARPARDGHPALGAPWAGRTSELHSMRSSALQSSHAKAYQAGCITPNPPKHSLAGGGAQVWPPCVLRELDAAEYEEAPPLPRAPADLELGRRSAPPGRRRSAGAGALRTTHSCALSRSPRLPPPPPPSLRWHALRLAWFASGTGLERVWRPGPNLNPAAARRQRERRGGGGRVAARPRAPAQAPRQPRRAAGARVGVAGALAVAGRGARARAGASQGPGARRDVPVAAAGWPGGRQLMWPQTVP